MIIKRFANRQAAFHLGMQALMSSFGGVANTGFAVVVLFSVMSIGWFSDELFSLIPEGYKIAALLPLLFLFLLYSFFGRFPLKQVAPNISQHAISSCKALIWFLSPPGRDKTGEETQAEDMASWRMAYEAISRHNEKEPLKAVVVIPSSDTDEKKDGTFHVVSQFISSMSKATQMTADKFMLIPDYQLGVDFEDAGDIYKAVEAAYDYLESLGIKGDGVVLDITGGQKLPGTIGGIAGLGEGRRFQYVSTRNYRIQEYHITYKVVS